MLLVDDEPAALSRLQERLAPHLPDCDVDTARKGREAIVFLEEHPVDALVTDVNMPIVDGFALLAHVSRNQPQLPAVALSVMAPEAVHHGLPTLGSIRVLRKPAAPALIAQTILGALAELRARAGDARRLLEGVSPLLVSAAVALATPDPSGGPDGRRHGADWHDVAQLAERLAHAADRLSGPSHVSERGG